VSAVAVRVGRRMPVQGLRLGLLYVPGRVRGPRTTRVRCAGRYLAFPFLIFVGVQASEDTSHGYFIT